MSGPQLPARDAAGTWAILVAAGSGSRLGGDQPKAFVGARRTSAPRGEPGAARPLGLDRCPRRRGAAGVGGADDPPGRGARRLEGRCRRHRRRDPGRVGPECARRDPDDALVVLVHDAARPLVDDAILERVLGGLAEGVDGVVPGLPLRDTIKRVERGVVVETIPRDELVAVQTPQAFLADRLRAAYSGDLAGATDCASLIERAGGRIGVVAGDPRLTKVTTVDDLELVEGLLGEPEPEPDRSQGAGPRGLLRRRRDPRRRGADLGRGGPRSRAPAARRVRGARGDNRARRGPLGALGPPGRRAPARRLGAV